MPADAEVIEVRKTRTFDAWFRKLADRRAKEHDKRRQQADIAKACRMWSEWVDKHGA